LIPPFVEYQERESRVVRLDVVYCGSAIEGLRIPTHTRDIHAASFAGAKIRTLTFDVESRLRELNGFQCWPISHHSVPDSVEFIGHGAFAECRYLRSLAFGNDSRIWEVNGFQRTGIRSVSLPRSLETLGGYGFCQCPDLWLVQYCNVSAIRLISVDTLRFLALPNSIVRPVTVMWNGLRPQFFIDYHTSSLARNRRCAVVMLHRSPHVYSHGQPTKEAVPSWTVSSSWARLPILENSRLPDEPLRVTLRFPDRGVPFHNTQTAHACTFQSNSQETRMVSLGSFVAMFSASARFVCHLGTHFRCGQCILRIHCGRCGPEYGVKIRCPLSAQ
jgi:hypothetical protein